MPIKIIERQHFGISMNQKRTPSQFHLEIRTHRHMIHYTLEKQTRTLCKDVKVLHKCLLQVPKHTVHFAKIQLYSHM